MFTSSVELHHPHPDPPPLSHEWRRVDAKPNLQVYTCLLAETCLRAGRHAEAREHLGQALPMGERTGERWWEARVYDVPRATAAAGALTDAEASFQTALRMARAQGTRSWELRAATSLAQLWAEQSERKALDLLAPVYAWFTRGLRERRSEGREGAARRAVLAHRAAPAAWLVLDHVAIEHLIEARAGDETVDVRA